MFKLLFSGLIIFTGFIASIYNYSVIAVDNTEIKFSNYQHKKILIVNTATGSNQVSQLAQLQQLYLQHQDSVVIIAFPSNSFGHEPGNNASIKTIMQGTYGVSFPIAAKSPVKGDSANIIYQWLGRKMLNSVMNGRTRGDFQKYLIDTDGKIVAEFDSSINPLSTVMQNAIHNDW